MKTLPVANCDTLLAELTSIERWDREYYQRNHHAQLERDAYQHRQERRQEIISEILGLRRSQATVTGDAQLVRIATCAVRTR